MSSLSIIDHLLLDKEEEEEKQIERERERG